MVAVGAAVIGPSESQSAGPFHEPLNQASHTWLSVPFQNTDWLPLAATRTEGPEPTSPCPLQPLLRSIGPFHPFAYHASQRCPLAACQYTNWTSPLLTATPGADVSGAETPQPPLMLAGPYQVVPANHASIRLPPAPSQNTTCSPSGANAALGADWSS